MSREIKFKAKRIDNGEWIEGAYVLREYIGHGNMVDGVTEKIKETSHEIATNGFNFIEVIPETVGQFTGLTDKNGTEIYEGDIVRHYSKFYEPDVKVNPELFENDETGTIQFKGGCFGFISLDGCSEIYGALETNEDTSLGFEEYWFEVIGNIHTNPELLEA